MTSLKIPELKKEEIDHPNYYNKGIEAIEIIESWDLGFCLGNAIKYILRAPYKGTHETDIDKALWYLNRYKQNFKVNNK